MLCSGDLPGAILAATTVLLSLVLGFTWRLGTIAAEELFEYVAQRLQRGSDDTP